MIVDTSALISIVKGESDAQAMSDALETDAPIYCSAATYLEAFIVVQGYRNPKLTMRLEEIFEHAKIQIEPVTAEQAKVARQAYRDYGRGSGHPANLNFGDCFSYALARAKHEPILFKGNDFCHTDLRAAI